MHGATVKISLYEVKLVLHHETLGSNPSQICSDNNGSIFCLQFSPVRVIPRMLHTHLLYVALTRRTNGWNMRALRKATIF